MCNCNPLIHYCVILSDAQLDFLFDRKSPIDRQRCLQPQQTATHPSGSVWTAQRQGYFLPFHRLMRTADNDTACFPNMEQTIRITRVAGQDLLPTTTRKLLAVRRTQGKVARQTRYLTKDAEWRRTRGKRFEAVWRS